MKFALTLERIVREGERYPTGYGYAYTDFMGLEKVAYPIPLNLIVRAARSIWVTVMLRLRGRHLAWYEKRFLRAYYLGAEQARRSFEQHITNLLLDWQSDIPRSSVDELVSRWAVLDRILNELRSYKP